MFEIRLRDGLARIGHFKTAHGTVETPTLLPVINPNIMTITPAEMKEAFGIRMLITNSYIIWKNPELREKALKDGVHSLIDFDGAIMTDSGTFQSYVYGSEGVKPLQIVEFQRDIGVDVGTILDVFSLPDDSHSKVKKDMLTTIKRARESAEIKGDMMLAGTIQGSVFPDLRRECAEQMSSLDLDFHPIGGVVPLMESYRYADLVDAVMNSRIGLDPSRPTHLFGAGHPMIFPMAALMGMDFFDSSSYVKYARDGRLMFPDGTGHLKDLKEMPCTCPICSEYTPDELRAMPEEERVKAIAMHNLYVSFAELRRVKVAIREGSLWELVEERARSHPSLLNALRRLSRYRDYMEKYEPASRSGSVFYTGRETLNRPLFYRYNQRLKERYRPPVKSMALVNARRKPYHKDPAVEAAVMSGKHPLIMSMFGPVPYELGEMYPIAQSLEPEEFDDFERDWQNNRLNEFINTSGIDLNGEAGNEVSEEYLDRIHLSAVMDMQFGKGASEIIRNGRLKVVRSKNTGKIRNIYLDGRHILSMRAGDGLFTLKIDGGRLLHSALSPPKMRVIVGEDSAVYNRQGFNVFPRFIISADPELRPGDECLVVTEEDELVAIGTLVMPVQDISYFRSGIAVRVRDGLEDRGKENAP